MIDHGRAATVGDYLEWLGWPLSRHKRPPSWPPDAFAIVASLLRRADAYRAAVTTWVRPVDWLETVVESVAREWRHAAAVNDDPPDRVLKAWRVISRKRATPIERVHEDRTLCGALIEICAMADEACNGVGIPGESTKYRSPDAFEKESTLLLLDNDGRSLCRQLPVSRVVVLPKMHTPQSGMSIRSLTHNLAVWDRGEVVPIWRWFPWVRTSGFGLNVLLVPLPYVVTPSAFRTIDATSPKLPPDYGFFWGDFVQFRGARLRSLVQSILSEAKIVGGDVHMVVFPEASLSTEDIRALAAELDCLVVGGVSAPATKNERGTNEAALELQSTAMPYSHRQAKHHAWKLDQRQIQQYSLGGTLDPSSQWWEFSRLGPRTMEFASVDNWLAMCVLICEDLARQDPVAELVRSVGPNLVVALLQDGPQLVDRWSSRYATVLADDPGSSVLTLTSLGMAQLARAPDKPTSRVVALWKEHGGASQPIALENGACAVLLNLTREAEDEYSADGRGDAGAGYYLRLSGTHQIPATRAISGNLRHVVTRRRRGRASGRSGRRAGALPIGDVSRLAFLAYVARRDRAGASQLLARVAPRLETQLARAIARVLVGGRPKIPAVRAAAKYIRQWAANLLSSEGEKAGEARRSG